MLWVSVHAPGRRKPRAQSFDPLIPKTSWEGTAQWLTRRCAILLLTSKASPTARWWPSSAIRASLWRPRRRRRYRAELMEKFESDFIPYTFQVPISVAVGKVAADFRLVDVVVLDEPQFRPHVITENFWRGWEKYHRPTLVSFNGRGFDLPLLELAAFRYGLSLPGWFQSTRQTCRAIAEPLQHDGPYRPLRAADQLRQHALQRRIEPGGQSDRQARQDGRARQHGPGPVTTGASWPRSTITAAATCWTPTSFSSARR